MSLQEYRNPVRTSFSLSLEAFCLTLHVLYDDVVDLADGLSVFQNQPWFVCMEVDLDQCVITDNQQAVALEVFRDVVIDDILVQVMSLNQKLCIEFEFQLFCHENLLLLFFFCRKIIARCGGNAVKQAIEY